jgi:UDP-N-acetylmuramyl tripeptide synthase
MQNLLKRMGLVFTILVTKLAIMFLRLFNSGGTSLPGKIALKIYPRLFTELADRLRIIIITGTNGKTTTSRIVAGMLNQKGIKFIANKSGANLPSGIATTLVGNLSLTGKALTRTALLEIDEGAFRTLAPKLKPEVIIVTNFFRDQLDRFGEVNAALNHVREGILGTNNSTLILNADDSLCASLGKDVPNPVFYFGIGKDVYPKESAAETGNVSLCIYCNSKYDYSSTTYGHLGHFHCPSCGYERPNADIECTQILGYDNISSTIEIQTPDQKLAVKLALPGLYNIYNALAATAYGYFAELSEKDLVCVLEGFECGFGRMEVIKVQNREIKMILVKNPVGFNQVLKFLMTHKGRFIAAFSVNDRLGDGTDISWLWDVDFEILSFLLENIRVFYVSGLRAEDMAVRLKYAGIPENLIKIQKNEKELISGLLSTAEENETIYILPTYTAMLDIRKVLKDRFKLRDFWE